MNVLYSTQQFQCNSVPYLLLLILQSITIPTTKCVCMYVPRATFLDTPLAANAGVECIITVTQ